MTTDQLKLAQERLAAEDERAALEALLSAWRTCRVTRVAELIELLSARITRRLEPIRARTIAARTQTWNTIAARKDPADVERLLAVLWPPRWQAAMELLSPLVGWPDDPRIAMGLLRALREDRYNTWTAYRFHGPLIRLLRRMCDPRTLEPMKAWAGQEHPGYIERQAKPAAREAITAMAEQLADYPALGAAEALICAELELALGGGAQVRAQEQREALLRQVHENPRDLTCRQVYADLLSEQGDPQGEFITLQLATRPDAKSRRREAALLGAHRRSWLGPLGRRVEEQSVVFAGGFPAEVKLKPIPGQLPQDLSHPAWSTVKVISFESRHWKRRIPAGMFHLPWVQALDGIFNLSEGDLAEVSGAPLTRLGIRGGIEEEPAWAVLQQKSAFPNLSVLALDQVTLEVFGRLCNLPLLKRLRQLRMAPANDNLLQALVGRLGQLPVALEEVWLLRSRYRPELHNPTGWYEIFRRDETGRLTRLTLAWGSGGGTFHTYGMELDLVPKEAISSLELELPRRQWSQSDRQTIEEACSRFGLDVAFPWSGAPCPLEVQGPGVMMSLYGEEGIDKRRLDLIWSWLQGSPLGYVHDSFRVNSGIHRTLGSDPLAQLTRWLKPSTRHLELYSDGQRDLRHLFLGGHRSVVLHTDGFSQEGFAERFLDWVSPLLDRLELMQGAVTFADGYCLTEEQREALAAPLAGLYESPSLQDWVSVLGEPIRTLLTPEDLDRAAAQSDGQVRVTHGQRCSVVVLGQSPLAPQNEVLTEPGVMTFHREVKRCFRENFARLRGFEFDDHVRDRVTPAAQALGLERWPDEEGALPTLRFGARRGERSFFIHFQLTDLLDQPTLGAGMHGEGIGWRPLGAGQRNLPASSTEELEGSLRTITDQLPTTAARYMEQCLSGKKP